MLGFMINLARATPSLSMLNLGCFHQTVAELRSKELQNSSSILCPPPLSLQLTERGLWKKASTHSNAGTGHCSEPCVTAS